MEGDQLTVWTGSQRPFGVQEELSEPRCTFPKTSVRVIVPDTGSAYGGKHTGEPLWKPLASRAPQIAP